jgi:NitT/TauT family transport system ATP-binding protein
MDEPFGALDAQTRSQMQELLIMLWEQERNLIIFVTHDIQEAILLADRIIILPNQPVSRIENQICVPFPRPRCPDIVFDPDFIEIARTLRRSLYEKTS